MSTVQPSGPAPQATSSAQPATTPVEGRVTSGAAALQSGNQARQAAQGAASQTQQTAQGQPQQAPAQQRRQAPLPQSTSALSTSAQSTLSQAAAQSQPPVPSTEPTAPPPVKTPQGRTAPVSGPAPQATPSSPQSQPPLLVPQDVTVTRVQIDGSVSIRAAGGEATIEINPRQIPGFLRPGAVVSLILQRTENGLQALLQPRSAVQTNAAANPVSGKPLPSTGETSSATSTTAPAARTLPPLSDGQIARAIVLRPTSLPQGIAGGPLPPPESGIKPQQAAQAAAKYLLASSPLLKQSGSAPSILQSAVFQTSSPPQQPVPPAQTIPGSAANTAPTPTAQGPSLPSSGSAAPQSPVPSPTAATTATTTVTTTASPTAPSQSTAPVTPGQTTITPETARTASTGQPASTASVSPSVPQGTSENRSAATTLPQTSSAGATSGAAATVAAAPKPGTALPPGTDFPVRVLAVGTQASNALPAQSGSGGTVISGTVVATGGSGQAIVNSSVGLLDVAARTETGQLQSAIRMEILGRSEGDMRGRAEGGRQTPLAVLAREWPALEESLRVLEMAGQQSAAQFASAIARPGPQLTASMLFFLAAVRGGSLGGWLGKDASQTLEKSHSRLLSTLSSDFQSISRASEGGPETAGWRAFFMPVQTQETLEQIRLFILPPSFDRSGEEGDEQNDERDNHADNAETRFVVDLMLSGLGPFQIDGSVDKQSMSLLIRTRRALPPEMRAEIIEIFEKTAGRTGMSGAVSFKVQKEFPPLPIADLMPDGQQGPDVYA